jgi:uncharacterized protein YecT (DUF1311 family)
VIAAPAATAAPAAPAPAANCRDTATTTVEMNACAGAARKKADAELNQVYGQLQAALRPAQKGQLKRAERAWIAFRDAHCAFATSFSAGGSIHSVDLAYCLADATAHRVTELRAALEQASR